jgi:hypothetical protein
LPETAYTKAWKENLARALSVPALAKVSPPHDFPLSFRLKEGDSMKSWTLFSSFPGVVDDVTLGAVPGWFTEQKTDACVRAFPQAENQLGLFIPKTKWTHKSMNDQSPEGQEAASFGFILDKQAPVKVVLDDESVHDLPDFGLPMPVAASVNQAMFTLPGAEKCSVGSCWSVPAGLCYEYPVDCKVISLAQWGAREVAEVEVVCNPSGFGKWAALGLVPNEPRFKPFIDQYAKLEFQYLHSGKVFIDVSTGLALYHCYTNTIETKSAQTGTTPSVVSSFFVNMLTFES